MAFAVDEDVPLRLVIGGTGPAGDLKADLETVSSRDFCLKVLAHGVLDACPHKSCGPGAVFLLPEVGRGNVDRLRPANVLRDGLCHDLLGGSEVFLH